ncbi:LysE/ArgO family amino acid transporter [Celerinatantimonas sp. YJH-8]|uniref:LysE/ArgO family amino acid transporter n=1 Tax=Celerinatantimonas sp. YJH-8 TaxID=3228714 RepID=UPI0038C0B866
MLTSTLITGFTSGAGLLVCIGSQNAFVLRQGLLRNHLFVVASICILSDIILISGGISGLGMLIQQWPKLIELIRYGGGIFLAVNAILAAKRAWDGGGQLKAASTSVSKRTQIMLTCLGYTWLNPHVYIDTILLLGSLSMHYSGVEKWKFGIGALTASFIWFISITYGAKLLLPLFHSPHAWRILDIMVAVMLAYFSVSLITTPITG